VNRTRSWYGKRPPESQFCQPFACFRQTDTPLILSIGDCEENGTRSLDGEAIAAAEKTQKNCTDASKFGVTRLKI
jgi:hypothetical protein